MKEHEAEQKIVRIVDHQTSPEQPDTVARHTIMQIATRDELTLPEADTALNSAVESGLLIEENGSFRVA